LIGYFEDGRLPLDKLVKTYSLDQINDAIADAHNGKAIKAVLLID
jgi:aryl-alcohol dehydrogenase